MAAIRRDIKNRKKTRTSSGDFPPATQIAILEAESQLRFELPSLLKAILREVANGGFGPGLGGTFIGVADGYASDFGTLVETHNQLESDSALLKREWPRGLLPFCEWGCNIFSCVDCLDSSARIYQLEQGDLYRQEYSLNEFVAMWINGDSILDVGNFKTTTVKITNPFSGKEATVKKRTRKNKP